MPPINIVQTRNGYARVQLLYVGGYTHSDRIDIPCMVIHGMDLHDMRSGQTVPGMGLCYMHTLGRGNFLTRASTMFLQGAGFSMPRWAGWRSGGDKAAMVITKGCWCP